MSELPLVIMTSYVGRLSSIFVGGDTAIGFGFVSCAISADTLGINDTILFCF